MEKENATTAAKTAKKNIWGKLMSLQKELKTFAVTDDSGKIDNRGKAEYRYTPGWAIVEAIREKMDGLGLMLISEFETTDIRQIAYPVYKMVNGTPMSFEKKEMFVTVRGTFTWFDTETGEKAGPFNVTTSGANGTDKSTVTAISFAERYFLLKFFHVTTRELDEEPDAHDSDALPGIPAGSQPMPASASQRVSARPATAAAVPSNAPHTQQPAQQQPMPQQGGLFPPAQGMPAYQQQYAAQVQPGGFNLQDPIITETVSKLANFEKGTPTFQQMLNAQVGILAAKGYSAYEPTFVQNLADTAQAVREGKVQLYK